MDEFVGEVMDECLDECMVNMWKVLRVLDQCSILIKKFTFERPAVSI